MFFVATLVKEMIGPPVSGCGIEIHIAAAMSIFIDPKALNYKYRRCHCVCLLLWSGFALQSSIHSDI